MKPDSKAIRRIILEQSYRAGVGHIGSALSVADILALLYGRILEIPGAEAPHRDRFVLSKGHAALALYAALYLTGRLDETALHSYCADDSLLGVHPEHQLPFVDFSTGSLGLGLAYAAGSALAARLQGSPRRVYALLSDAECNEGSLWEAVLFAGHHRLCGLTAIVDNNGQQAFGYTRNVLCQESLRDRWQSMGWRVAEADGHDVNQMNREMLSFREERSRPQVLLARTVFGKGVSYMENEIHWHYWPMNQDQYQQAIFELERTP